MLSASVSHFCKKNMSMALLRLLTMGQTLASSLILLKRHFWMLRLVLEIARCQLYQQQEKIGQNSCRV